MAAARQKEIKVNITVVATKTFTAGFVLSGTVAMLQVNSGNYISRVHPFRETH
jgi:hypothetical protein